MFAVKRQYLLAKMKAEVVRFFPYSLGINNIKKKHTQNTFLYTMAVTPNTSISYLNSISISPAD